MKPILSATLLAAACTIALPALAQPPSAEQQFVQMSKQFLQRYLELNPETATSLGDHRFDGRWTDYSPAGIQSQLSFERETLKRLEEIPQASLSRENVIDYDILKSNLEGMVWTTETLAEYRWNPLSYNPGSSLYLLVARDFAPRTQRLESLTERLEGLPKLLDQARQNLQNPPRVDVTTAISQNKGSVAFIETGLDEFVKGAPDAARLAAARKLAASALHDYGKWLETDLLPRANGNFRLGAKRYATKLKFTLESDLKPEEILGRAQQELTRTHRQMDVIAAALYPRVFNNKPTGLTPRQITRHVLDKISESHPSNANILKRAANCLAEATDFVKRHHLVSLPKESIRIVEMPEFNRGVASAYCDSPGPLEGKGETFFAIAPTPADWSPQRVESFYREYNDSMLRDLTVHEAMPGHFLQLMHANHFKAPTRLRAVFQSGTFVEGWATYAEQFMADAGFGGPEEKLSMLKMHLRLILNAILDEKIHVAGMTENEAKKLMMEEGYQEEGEATEKWHRACVTSCQLSTYFVGNLELNDLSRAYRQRHPGADWQEVHDRMLAFGSPAPRYVKRLLGL